MSVRGRRWQKIHGRRIQSEFKNGKQGSTDDRIGLNSKGSGAEIRGRPKLYEFLKAAAVTHGRPN